MKSLKDKLVIAVQEFLFLKSFSKSTDNYGAQLNIAKLGFDDNPDLLI